MQWYSFVPRREPRKCLIVGSALQLIDALLTAIWEKGSGCIVLDWTLAGLVPLQERGLGSCFIWNCCLRKWDDCSKIPSFQASSRLRRINQPAANLLTSRFWREQLIISLAQCSSYPWIKELPGPDDFRNKRRSDDFSRLWLRKGQFGTTLGGKHACLANQNPFSERSCFFFALCSNSLDPNSRIQNLRPRMQCSTSRGHIVKNLNPALPRRGSRIWTNSKAANSQNVRQIMRHGSGSVSRAIIRKILYNG